MLPKKLSPVIFGLAFIFFFLPWLNVSCQGQKILSLSGWDLSFKSSFEPSANKMFGQTTPMRPTTQKSSRDNPTRIIAMIAFLITLAGIAVGFLKPPLGSLTSIAAGALGIILLIIVRLKISGEMGKAEAFIQISYGIGYYLTFLMYIVAIIYSALTMKGAPATLTVPQPARAPTASSSGKNFCMQCGAPNEGGNAFCNSCGAKLT